MLTVSNNAQIARSSGLSVLKKPESKSYASSVSFEGKGAQKVKTAKIAEMFEKAYNKLPEGVRTKIASAVSHVKKGFKFVIDKVKEAYNKVKTAVVEKMQAAKAKSASKQSAKAE